MSLKITDASEPADMPLVRELFQEYASWLGVDLCFQGFAAELAGLPGRYAAPAGALLLAFCDDRAAGCGAMRALADSVCEMKRLWVREHMQGAGTGRALVAAVIDRARRAGYARIRLDTLPQMQSAAKLYRDFGFYEIPPYCVNPDPRVRYLEKRLDEPVTAQANPLFDHG